MPGLDRPLLVYDGDCGFCVRWIVRGRALTGERVEYAPYQRVCGGARVATAAGAESEAWQDPRLAAFAPVPRAEFGRSVFLFEPGGRVTRAGEAACRTLAHAPRSLSGLLLRTPLLLYRAVPGVRSLVEGAYRFVARHRSGLLRVERVLVGDVVTPTWERSRALFVRGLALATLVAFVSLWVQIDGLAGSRGLAPAAEAFADAAPGGGPAGPGAGGDAWLAQPSLLWLDSSDAMLHGLCLAGVALALLMLCGIAPAPCALLLWADYLSLTHGCGPFLTFQWDTLLIETLLLAVFVAPWRFTLRGAPPPPRLARLLVRWLLFRFMFESGVVKLTSGDDAWSDLTALTYHYMTQPLPHVLGWWIWQMPRWFHEVSCAGTLAIELGAPFLILGPRRVRQAGCALMLALQALIGATGNYGFFNLLTILLCLALLDDQALATLGRGLRGAGRVLWRSARRRDVRHGAEGAATDGSPADALALDEGCGVAVRGGELAPYAKPRRAPLLQRVALALFAVPVLTIGGLQLHELFGAGPRITVQQFQAGVVRTLLSEGPAAAADVLEVRAEPFLSVNAYGLFRVMTRTRPEILIRGSLDGITWRDYAFRWKPGDVRRAPAWVQPHMPRLDWRLWFEALRWEPAADGLTRRGYSPSPWFLSLLQHLLAAEPATLELIAGDPFPDGPPRYVRASLSRYRFTTRAERAATGAWWIDEPLPDAWVQVSRKE